MQLSEHFWWVALYTTRLINGLPCSCVSGRDRSSTDNNVVAHTIILRRNSATISAKSGESPYLTSGIPSAVILQPSRLHICKAGTNRDLAFLIDGCQRGRVKGKQPRVSNMLASDHLRPAAIAAGVKIAGGQRFGFHNLRHRLGTLLVTKAKTDPKTVQALPT